MQVHFIGLEMKQVLINFTTTTQLLPKPLHALTGSLCAVDEGLAHVPVEEECRGLDIIPVLAGERVNPANKSTTVSKQPSLVSLLSTYISCCWVRLQLALNDKQQLSPDPVTAYIFFLCKSLVYILFFRGRGGI